MYRSVYEFNFSKRVPTDDIEDSLALAALATEALHGRSAIINEAAFRFDRKHRKCVVDAETSIGCDIARILTAFITKGYGESAFNVERAESRVSGNHSECVAGSVS